MLAKPIGDGEIGPALLGSPCEIQPAAGLVEDGVRAYKAAPAVVDDPRVAVNQQDGSQEGWQQSPAEIGKAGESPKGLLRFAPRTGRGSLPSQQTQKAADERCKQNEP
jgi:hypothetical protein